MAVSAHQTAGQACVADVIEATMMKTRTPGNHVNGANIAGFLKVADAMMDQGLV